MHKNQKGQISIFFATSLFALITFLAFIINIGYFVKAKINLQNATDAAAFAGASVQARQLSNIAYLNWEMHNIYKEWMFKYYVLGNINLDVVESGASGNKADFLMESFTTSGVDSKDSYNFPSTCIDFSASGNVSICRKYLVPGLPRFESTDVYGYEETLNAFQDAIGAQKAANCSQRTQINFLTNQLWAFNVLTGSEFNNFNKDAPQIAANRLGAFPAALTLAMRIRNLEAMVNKKPYSEGVCVSPGSGVNCGRSIDEITTSDPTPGNERINKAFYSGFRNIGGVDCDNPGADELKCFFTLTEISPRTISSSDEYSLSNLLIPKKYEKYYLDLQLLPVNFATFYTMFATRTQADGYNIGGTQAESSAECVATKIGMPIPGYPMGYVKNPNYLTYYAVRAQSKFVGLFNPFAGESVTLTAFSAAKPFGGRIGPAIFGAEGSKVTSRVKAGAYRSSPYISSIDTSQLVDDQGKQIDAGVYAPGSALPGNYGGAGQKFWIGKEGGNVGGWIDGPQIFFGIPNLPYDYPNPSAATSPAQYYADTSIQILNPKSPLDAKAGLYNGKIFNKFRSNLPTAGGNVSVDSINDGILKSKSPTLYEANNYLIPTTEEMNSDQKTDSFGIITQESNTQYSGGQIYDMQIFAPLISSSSEAVYKSLGDLDSILDQYLKAQEVAIEKYIGAMNLAADAMYDTNYQGATGTNIGLDAAKVISDLPEARFSSGDDVYADKPGCSSIAGKFIWFYTGKTEYMQAGTPCQSETLRSLLKEFWSTTNNQFYVDVYVPPTDSNIINRVYSGYRPGQMNDGDATSGRFQNFNSGSSKIMKRNFYSSKFITLSSITSEGLYSPALNSPIMSEGGTTHNSNNLQFEQRNFANPINPGDVGLDISRVKH